jgi:hypothetical protein
MLADFYFSFHVRSNFLMGTASARTSDPGANPWPLDLRILNCQPLDLKSTE